MDIYEQAVLAFGSESQLEIAVEECAELINAIQKMKRGRAMLMEVVTEIADVEIMCRQLELIFGSDRVARERERKLERLEQRIQAFTKKPQ